eukprot:7695689-Heterocapsa_arctica.AAC.1
MLRIFIIPNWVRLPSEKDSSGSTMSWSAMVTRKLSILLFRVRTGNPPSNTPKSSCLRPHAPPRGL